MRPAALLLLLLFAPAAAAGDPAPPPRIAAEATHATVGDRYGRRESKPATEPEFLEGAARREFERLFRGVHTVRLLLYRIENTTEDTQAERLAHVLQASGRYGELLTARDLTRRSGTFRYYMESAESAVVAFPRVDAVQQGVWLAAEVLPFPGEATTLRYRIIVTGAATIETRDSIAGRIDYTSVPALHLEGGARIRPGEALTATAAGSDGSGWRAVLRLESLAGKLDPLTDLGDGWTAVPAAHLSEPPFPEAPWTEAFHPGVLERASGKSDPETSFDRALESADDPGLGWDPGPAGLRFGEPEPDFARRLRTVLAGEASARAGRLSVTASGPGLERVSLPVSPGEAFRFSNGTVDSFWSGTEVQAGCWESVGAAPRVRWTQTGVSGSGRVRADGRGEIELVSRELLSVEWRPYQARRMVTGFREHARENLSVPLVRDRIRLYRGGLSNDPVSVGGSLRARLTGDGVRESQLLTVQEDQALRPVEGPVVVADITRRTAVTQWETEGWCGMTMRYPDPDLVREMPSPRYDVGRWDAMQVWEGHWIRVTHHEGELGFGSEFLADVEADVRGKPQSLATFDPLDGEVEIIRQPRLRAELRGVHLDLSGAIAWGDGLWVTVGDLGSRRTGGVAFRGGDREVGLASCAGGRVESGGTAILPTWLSCYTSNHEMGEVTTHFGVVRDGVTLTLHEPESGARRLDFESLSRPDWKPQLLRIVNSPERSENRLRTLKISRRVLRRTFWLPEGTPFRYDSPHGSREPFSVSAGGR